MVVGGWGGSWQWLLCLTSTRVALSSVQLGLGFDNYDVTSQQHYGDQLQCRRSCQKFVFYWALQTVSFTPTHVSPVGHDSKYKVVCNISNMGYKVLGGNIDME